LPQGGIAVYSVARNCGGELGDGLAFAASVVECTRTIARRTADQRFSAEMRGATSETVELRLYVLRYPAQ